MQTQGILRTVERQLTALCEVNDQRTLRHATCATRVHDVVCHVPHVRHQKLDAATRLQESGNEGTETDHGASGSLEVGRGTSRVLGTSARRSAGARGATGARGRRTRTGGASAVGSSRRARSGLVEDEGGGVVGAENVGLGGVTVGNGDGVDAARGDGRNGSREADVCVNRGLRGDSSGLSGNGSVSGRLVGNGGRSSGLASHDTQRVGLSQVRGLGEGIDRGLSNC